MRVLAAFVALLAAASALPDFQVIELEPGRNLYYYTPESGRTTGMMVIMHPRGAAALSWMQSVMMVEIMELLENLGYSIVAPDSHRRGIPDPPFYPVWELEPYVQGIDWANNIDVQNFQRMIAFLEGNGSLGPATPLYSMGMSQGCDAIPLLGTVVNMSAASCQSGSGWKVGNNPGSVFQQSFATTRVPTLFSLGSQAVGGDGANEDRDLLQEQGLAQLQAVGVDVAQVRLPQAKPVEPSDFARIAGFPSEDQVELVQILRDSGCLDANDRQFASPPWPQGCQNYGRFNLDAALRANIESILRCTFGGNCMDPQFGPYLVSWMKDHQARVGVPCAPNCK